MVYTPIPGAVVARRGPNGTNAAPSGGGVSSSGLVITRFAPAPTGYLHLGHVVNAIHVWQAAHDRDGQVLLRIEDHDRQRSRPEYEAAILEDLAWLGFRHDGPVVRQRERDALYRQALQPLIDRELVYGCTCSRAEILAVAGDQSAAELRYPNTCRDRGIPLTDDVGWRLRMEPGTESFFDEMCGPQVQDPAAQCGDLLLRTGRQIRLARLLGRATMPRFAHHGLVMKSATEKLSKSDGATGIRDLRAAGWSAEAVLDHARKSVTLPP